jgi:adenylate kinase family enzyme
MATMRSLTFKKIMIFGRPGSGKSTFALWLHRQYGHPLHHLDKYFYEENWIERDYQEFLRIQQEIVNTKAWIIDGNAIHSLAMRYERAHVVLYFNFPRWRCFLRIIKRQFFKDPNIKDRACGCPELITWKLLKYMWNFESRVAGPISQLKEKFPQVLFIEIKNDHELKSLTLIDRYCH